MWYILVINIMLPMEHTLIILKSQFIIHYKIYLIIYVRGVQNNALQFAFQNEIHSKLNHRMLIL